MVARALTVAFFWSLAASLMLARPAEAYIDPGAGSMFLQVVLAALFGAAYCARSRWQQLVTGIRGFLSRGRRPTDGESG